MIRQRITADPERGDGHDAAGNPGDCLRTAVANLLDVPYEDVPHFAQHVGWWDYLRRWARRRGGDFTCLAPENGSVRHAYADPTDNSSDAGLLEVVEVLAYCDPYDPPPRQLLLEGAS